MTMKLDIAYNKFDYEAIPPITMAALKRYIEKGAPTGDFLYAILTNDLFKAVEHADDMNVQVIPQIVVYLYNQAPIGCRGSKENVQAWIEMER